MGLALYNGALMEVPLPLVLMQKLLSVNFSRKFTVQGTLKEIRQLDLVL